MSILSEIARWEMTFFFYGILAVVGFQLLTGHINTKYLLWGTRRDGSRYFSPERVQLLLLTLATAFNLLIQVFQNPDPTRLPVIADKWVALFGSSHGVYLAGKAFMQMRR